MHILILGDIERDPTAGAVALQLTKRGVSFSALDARTLGADIHLSDDPSTDADFINGLPDIEKTSVVWYRRLSTPKVTEAIEDLNERFFAEETWYYAIVGSLTRCETWVNPFLNHRAANNKIFQLRLASRRGLYIPKTLITSSPQAARQFVSPKNNYICKAAHNHFRGVSGATVLLSDEKLEFLDALAVCPAIFQERITVQKNIRVVFCGSTVFSFESDDCGIDWRLEPNNSWRLHSLPSALQARLRDLISDLRLIYAVIDMILDKEGRYVFLEVNPGGQFMFLELWTEAGIPSAMADMLISAGSSTTFSCSSGTAKKQRATP